MYLCLEDTLDRLQRRLVEVTGGESGRIYLATQAEIMGKGLEEQLTGFLTDHPEVGLVIIDTLQKIRELRSEQYSYAGDYNAMSTLKGIADQFGVAVLVLHHTRKAASADPFQLISGTNGLMGCADSIFVMRKDDRTNDRVMLFGTGRDLPNLELELCFQSDPFDWVVEACFSGNLKPARDRELRQISEYVREHQYWEGTASKLSAALADYSEDFTVKPNALVRILNANSGLLEEYYDFRFQSQRVGNTKVITLTSTDRH